MSARSLSLALALFLLSCGGLRARNEREQKGELAAESGLLEQDVSRLREHLGSLAQRETGSAQDQLVKRILEREEQLRELKSKMHALDIDLLRKEQALGALFDSPHKSL